MKEGEAQMVKLAFDGKEIKMAERVNQSAKKGSGKVKAGKTSNKAGKAENK